MVGLKCAKACSVTLVVRQLSASSVAPVVVIDVRGERFYTLSGGGSTVLTWREWQLQSHLTAQMFVGSVTHCEDLRS